MWKRSHDRSHGSAPPKFLNFEVSCWNNWDKVKVVVLIAMRS